MSDPEWLLSGGGGATAPAEATAVSFGGGGGADDDDDSARQFRGLISTQRHLPPGPRSFGMVDPPRRALYRMMVRQLLADGFSDAAMSLVRSTGVIVSNPGANPQRLLDLVEQGMSANHMLHEPQQTASTSKNNGGGLIEDVVYGADPYSAFDVPRPSAFDFREWYTSKSFERPVRCLDFHASGSLVAVGTVHGDVRLYSVPLADEFARSSTTPDLRTPTDAALIRAMPHLHPGHSVETVAMHPQHTIIASGGRDGRVVFTKFGSVDPRAGATQHHQHHMQATQGAGLSGAGNNAAAAAAAHKTVAAHTDTYPVRCTAFHPTGDYLLFGTDHNVPRMYNVETGNLFTPMTSSPSMPTVAVGPATAGDRRYRDGGGVADMQQQQQQQQQQIHNGSIADVAFSNDGRYFASSAFDGRIRIYDGRRGGEVAMIDKAHCGVAVTSLQLSRSGYMVLSAGLDSQVRIWDLRKPQGGNEVAAFCTAGGAPLKQSFHARSRCCFSHDEHSIVTTNNTFTSVMYVDAATMKTTSTIDYWSTGGGGGGGGAGGKQSDKFQTSATATAGGGVSSGVIRAIAASPTRCMLAAGGDDMRMRLWAPALVSGRN